MLNKLLAFNRRYRLLNPGDTVICALSGGADSVALLFSLYLLKDKLGITLEATHFNHNLRGEESNRDEAFVRNLCDRYDIPLHIGSGQIIPGKKGLEAFDGVVLLASHDHEMLTSTCNRVIAFQPDGTIIDRYGTYDDYLAWMAENRKQ